MCSLETRPSPFSTRACSVIYNYAWEYFRRQKAWYILSRDACRDRRGMTFILWRQPFYQVGVAAVVYHILTSQHHTMTLYDSRGTHHVIKCTRPSADENTPTRNYNLRSMRAWRREKAWFRGYVCVRVCIFTASQSFTVFFLINAPEKKLTIENGAPFERT